MSYSVLPTWPLILFGVIEPALLIWGYFVGIRDPKSYYADQHPGTVYHATAILTPQAMSLSLQLVNVLLLLAGVAIYSCFTHHPDIPKKYLFVVALADFGHIYACYRALGDEYFWDVSKWNDMTWGNVGVSAFLNINRWATLLGLFGTIGGRKASRGKKEL